MWSRVLFHLARGEKEKDLTQIFATECVVELQCALGSSWGQAGRHLVLVWSGECMPIGREVKSCLSIM